MSKHAKTAPDHPENQEPPISACLYHRCATHQNFPQLNVFENGAECGACIGVELFFLERRFFDVLDILANHMSQSSAFKRLLGIVLDRERLREGEEAAERLKLELLTTWKDAMNKALDRPTPPPRAPDVAQDTIDELEKRAASLGTVNPRRRNGDTTHG